MKYVGLWCRYWLVVPGLRSFGHWLVPKHLLVQAWGRNDYPDEARVADMYVRSGRQDVTTLAALHLDQFRPGQPNIDLAADLCWVLAQRPNLHAWVQWEVAAAIDPARFTQFATRITVLWPPQSGYFDSSQVLEQAIERGFGADQTTVMVLAHQLMIVRMLLMVRRRLGCDLAAAPSNVQRCDRDSVQDHTTHRRAWYPREAVGRVVLWYRHLV